MVPGGRRPGQVRGAELIGQASQEAIDAASGDVYFVVSAKLIDRVKPGKGRQESAALQAFLACLSPTDLPDGQRSRIPV
jgi:hypothetical protein